VKVLIVDDEPPARERLKRLLDEMEDCRVVGEAGNGHEALLACDRSEPDIVLMDIRMPGMDGIEAARHLASMEQPPAVIFTTAYSEYAIEAFEAQAMGYLVKPVRRGRLESALRRARRPTRAQLAALAGEHPRPPRTHICARVGGELRLIRIEDILFFRAEQKYVLLRHRDGEVLIEEPLKDLEQELTGQFLRIHRNALIALRHLESLERHSDGQWMARLKDCTEELPVSRRQVSELRRLLGSRNTNR
jgi:two-component system response regulator AlgR